MIDKTDTFCVVGAGSSGIAAGKHLKQAGVPFEILEREDEVGGNWYYGIEGSSVYKSTHLISSKRMTEYLDYPMPEDYPDYPSHWEVCAYLRDYARHFGLYDHIRFNTAVANIEPVSAGQADSAWDVTLANGEVHRYKGVVIANGHNWDPKYPQYPGEFTGETVHSGNYKTPDLLRDKRVLVVGAGNSGCDIVVEAAQNAAQTFHSTRRGYYYVPKYAFGKPADVINEMPIRLGVPIWMRRFINGLILRVLVGDLTRYGLRKPDHKLLETHPIINQHITYYMGHGKITPKVDIEELCGDSVKFKDGSMEQLDVIVYATGYNITFPFMDVKHLDWDGKRPDLYINAFHRNYDTLFVIGLLQPDSGQFWLVDLQSELMAKYISGLAANRPVARSFKRTKATETPNLGGNIQYLESTRHYVEIAHDVYRRIAANHIKQFARDGVTV